jgi:fructoselysine 6-kinase
LTIVTMGPSGAIAADARQTARVPAVATEIVDTTGAGDSFIAGFLAASASGDDLPAALRAAAEWAAVTCGHLGGWPQEQRSPSRVE